LFVAVLGNRFSGTNVYGVIPEEAMQTGSKLDLVAIGGIVARAIEVPGYYGNKTLSAEVVGFPIKLTGEKLNINSSGIPAQVGKIHPSNFNCIVVCGTSAEVGKTTLTCSIGKQIKASHPDYRVGAIKACGTGRIKDLQSYQKAGFDVAVDYVDFGLSTTYGLPGAHFADILEQMANHVGKQTDVVMLEVGGDLYEANAPAVLNLGRELGAQFVLVVNDAMGAMEALRVLREQKTTPVCIASYKQNMHSLAERLQHRDSFYLDMNRPSDLITAVDQKLFPNFSHRPIPIGGFYNPPGPEDRI
jgi:molybdopterin-guanine dinucleotide biosynthesis protein